MVVVNRVLEVPSKAGTTYGSTQTRPPMNPLDYGRSQHVAAWLSPTGEARSLPTNVRAVPSTINNNSLRGARCCSYVDPMPEGGNSFGIGVNVDNFVEERWDRSHRSGSTPSIVRCKAMYQSEYMDRSNEALAGYRCAGFLMVTSVLLMWQGCMLGGTMAATRGMITSKYAHKKHHPSW